MYLRVPHPSRLLRRVGLTIQHHDFSSLLGFSCFCSGRFLKRAPLPCGTVTLACPELRRDCALGFLLPRRGAALLRPMSAQSLNLEFFSFCFFAPPTHILEGAPSFAFSAKGGLLRPSATCHLFFWVLVFSSRVSSLRRPYFFFLCALCVLCGESLFALRCPTHTNPISSHHQNSI